MREEGQEMILFGVLLAGLIVVGSVLAINLIVLHGQWNALNDVMVSAAAGGATRPYIFPGMIWLDPFQAKKVSRTLLRQNLAQMPFLDAPASQIANRADIRVLTPHGSCVPDPFEPRTCYRTPFVTIRAVIPVRLAWGEIVLSIPLHAAAQVGRTP